MSESLEEYWHRDRLIQYHIRRTRRKSLGVYVFPDGRVELRMPLRARHSRARAYVSECADWIVKQLARWEGEGGEVRRGPHRLPNYESGSEHFYAGQRYRLQVSQGSPQCAELVGEQLNLYCLDPSDGQRVERVLYQWYRQRAEEDLAGCLDKWWQRMGDELPHSARPELRFRRMKRRWGSCSQRGSILLNLELVRYHPRCWDLVLVHELCHLKIFNHSPSFYQLMSRHLPDWRERQRELDGIDRYKSVD